VFNWHSSSFYDHSQITAVRRWHHYTILADLVKILSADSTLVGATGLIWPDHLIDWHGFFSMFHWTQTPIPYRFWDVALWNFTGGGFDTNDIIKPISRGPSTCYRCFADKNHSSLTVYEIRRSENHNLWNSSSCRFPHIPFHQTNLASRAVVAWPISSPILFLFLTSISTVKDVGVLVEHS
jgi:hypothetical protein